MTERTVLKKELVSKSILRDPDIFRVTHDDGEIAYYNPMDGHMGFHQYELGFLLQSWIEGIRSMVEMLRDDDHVAFCENMTILLDAFERTVDEAFYFVMKDIGIITCRVADGNCGLRLSRRVLGTKLRPAKGRPEGGCAK